MSRADNKHVTNADEKSEESGHSGDDASAAPPSTEHH